MLSIATSGPLPGYTSARFEDPVWSLDIAERIYTRNELGELEPVEEEPFSTEDELQALIAEHPDLLDGEQIRPRDPRRWILITREKSIAESSGSGPRWAIDHLIVDQDAVPTLVEVKRGSSPEVRRSIVGQMLEYAAHAAQTWTADELRRTFESSSKDRSSVHNDELGKLLQADGEPDAEGFWERVATNLTARRLRLLFVADEIPDPLERVVEFLNAQMPHIEVLAVEIKQFRGKSTQTLVPRVLGRTADALARRTAAPRHNLTRESFLDEFTSEEARDAAVKLLETARESGATFEWGPSGVSVRGRCSRWKQPITVAWLYPQTMRDKGWMRTRDFTFGVGILDYDPGPDEELRTLLQAWAGSFRDDAFTRDASSKGVVARSVDYEAAAQHVDSLASRLAKVLTDLVSMPDIKG